MFKQFRVLLLVLSLAIASQLKAQQDTITVQTLTFDSAGRNYTFTFPDLPAGSYQKILMQYKMRCKGGRVSDGNDRNRGCGEWDYSSNTFITDSSLTDSSKNTHPSHLITNFSGSTFKYRSTATYDLLKHIQKKVTVGTVLNEKRSVLGNAITALPVLDNRFPSNKVQGLYTVAELTAAGFTAGNITGLSIFATQASGTLNNFKIRIKEVDKDTLKQATLDSSGFKTCYYSSFSPVSGENKVPFFENFTWTGTKNLLIEISFDASPGATFVLDAENGPLQNALAGNSGGDISFSGLGSFNLNALDFDRITDRISVAFWSKGDGNYIPANNTTIFEGLDSANQRQANVHLPWSDQNVYWDCGGKNGAYDRISKQATPDQYAGNWQFWVFSKDAVTGRLNIYRNGVNFTPSGGKRNPISIDKFRLGSDIAQNNFFYGQVDNFQVFDTSMAVTLAQSLYNCEKSARDLLTEHELINARATNSGFVDLSNSMSNLTPDGTVAKAQVYGYGIGRGMWGVARPKLAVLQTTYSSHNVTTHVFYDTLYKNAHRIIRFAVTNNVLNAVDTTYGYNDSTAVVYNEDGQQDSTFKFLLNKQIDITTLNYYAFRPQRLELMSFVTPYGIGLDLGMEGKMWEYDVSDFEPVLRGKRFLSMDFGGQFQEEIDIKFIFIKGTPARVPLSIRQIWPVEQRSYQDINGQKAFEERDVLVDAGTKSARIRSVISGHGQEGEFIPQNHTVSLNSGQKKFTWQVWKACADNPVYPQGGTWLNDRAGWCPGMATDMRLNDVTAFVTPGQNLKVKYSVANPGGDSRYIPNHQLVCYGAMNFAKDASIERILKPSSNIEFGRFNPACTAPQVEVKNGGKDTITKLKLVYWTNNGSPLEYVWTGSIVPLATKQIELPVTALSFWGSATNGVFHAKIAEVNTAVDEYAKNDQQSVAYTMPPIYSRKVLISYKTNNYASENSYTVKDIAGNVIVQKGGFAGNKTYNDTLTLPEGCYKFEFLDSGEDGLYYWYWEQTGQSRGTGSLKIKDLVTNQTKTYNPEFGNRVVQEFSVSPTVGVEETTTSDLYRIYPNPNTGRVFTVSSEKGIPADVKVFDSMGRTVSIHIDEAAQTVDLGDAGPGVYYINLNGSMQKVVVI